MENIDIGIVGLGWWGPKLLRNFSNHRSVNKIYGFDTSKEAIYNAQKQGLNFDPVEKLTDLFDNNISALIIATPPENHFELAKAALENEINVLITKPPSETTAQIEALASLVKEKNLIFMVDSTYIYNPVLNIVFKQIQSYGIKNLKSIRILRYGDELRINHISRLRDTRFNNNIDIVRDLIFHEISILICLFDIDLEIVSLIKFNNLNSFTSDSAIIIFRAGNIPIIIKYSWTYPERKREVQFYYEDKFLTFDDVSPKEKIWEFRYEDKKKLTYDYDQSEPLFCEIEHFISCIKNGEEPNTGIHFMKKAMEMMESIENFME